MPGSQPGTDGIVVQTPPRAFDRPSTIPGPAHRCLVGASVGARMRETPSLDARTPKSPSANPRSHQINTFALVRGHPSLNNPFVISTYERAILKYLKRSAVWMVPNLNHPGASWTSPYRPLRARLWPTPGDDKNKELAWRVRPSNQYVAWNLCERRNRAPARFDTLSNRRRRVAVR